MSTDLKQQSKLPANQCANASYTPAPWHISDYGYCNVEGQSCQIWQSKIDQDGNQKHIANVFDRRNPGGSAISLDEKKANAQLIASAPDLLEALQSILTASELGKYEGDDLRAIAIAQGKAQSAIEKAIGV